MSPNTQRVRKPTVASSFKRVLKRRPRDLVSFTNFTCRFLATQRDLVRGPESQTTGASEPSLKAMRPIAPFASVETKELRHGAWSHMGPGWCGSF